MFSKDARWDRHLPTNEIEQDKIDVAAIFKNGLINPTCFVWKKRKYNINQTTYTWQEKKGDEVFHYFSVTDGISLYHICLNSKFMNWRLCSVADM